MKLRHILHGTTAVVAVYVFLFIAVLKSDQLPGIPTPNNQRGLNLSVAWQDLHAIATRPRPYNSQANSLVHEYVLKRLEPIAAAYPHVHLVEDCASNGSFDRVYFEGTNILVKIDGTRGDDRGAVLFSAHYDSVSTSSGATDNAMAVVSMLQLVEKLAKTRSQRTAIFNFNNGEEDGLHGAHMFLAHPWSNLTETFFNLEGASSGSRPILFRATSTKPLEAFHHSHVTHPHGTILAADAFAARIIRSGTDYTVYSEGGKMQGLDLAFYKGRSYYHTKYDAIPFLRGGPRALWSMMEALDGGGYALLDQDDSPPSGNVVYFDLFGRFMVIFSMATMQKFNILLLVSVPIATLAFNVWPHLRHTQTNNVRIPQQMCSSSFKFWIGLFAVIASQVALVLGYLATNKYVIYSSPLTIAGSNICLAYLVFYLVTASSESPADPNAPLFQLVVFSYLILLATTLFLPIGGTYLFTALAACAFFGWMVGAVNSVLNQRSNTAQNEETSGEGAEPTESTPLIQQSSQATIKDDRQTNIVWFIQLLFVVPIPVLLFSHIGILLLGAMPQGIVDGGPVWIVYAALSLISIFLILPVAPFAASYPRGPLLSFESPLKHVNSPNTLFRFLLIILILTAGFISGFLGFLVSPNSLPTARLGFPFSIGTPMKVFFQQRVEIIAPWTTSREADDMVQIETRPTTYLTGVPYYLDQMIIPALPSASSNGAECIQDDDRKGLLRCGWPSGEIMLPWPGKSAPVQTVVDPGAQVLSKNPWLQSSIHRSSKSTRFTIRGTKTKTCRIYFDNVRVANWTVLGGGAKNKGYWDTQGDGPTELRLWSRTWDKEFVVDVSFIETPEKIKGRIGCAWAEYESGKVGLNDTIGGTIPAFEEALRFFPQWAALTKLTDGLVEVWTAFEV